MQPTIELTAAQIAFYRENGYLTLPRLTDPQEIQSTRAIYDRLFASRAGRAEGQQFDLGGTDEEGKTAVLPQILHPPKYAPELNDALFRANALAVARQLLGPSAQSNGDHAILKPAFHGADTPWHQDEAYWNPELDYQSLSIWMPLQPATIANGCMHFVPASQRLEVLPHHSIGHDPRVHGLEVDQADVSAAVACPIPAGGCTIHDSRTLHYAGPNRTDQPRRAYIMVFGTPPQPRQTPRRFPWEEAKRTARMRRVAQVAAGSTTAPGIQG